MKIMNSKNSKRAIVAVLTLTIVGVLFAVAHHPGPTVESPDEAQSVRVTLTPVAERVFEEHLILYGQVEAKHFALVPARIGGTIEALFVDEGDAVVAGETRLFQIDSLKLQQAMETRKQEREVAKFSRLEREASLRKMQAAFDKNQKDYERFQRLYETEAISQDELERAESAWKQGQAALEHGQALLDLAREQEKQSAVAWRMAEKDLSDTLIVAPIRGVVSERFHELGEMAGAGEPVLRIDDSTVVEVSASVAAEYYPRVNEGETRMRVRVNRVDVGEHVVAYKSPTVESRFRTFEIKIVLIDPGEGIVPGSMAQLDVVLQKRQGLGAPVHALVKRQGQQFVFAVNEGCAQAVPVEPGLEDQGWVELVGELPRGIDRIVGTGQGLLNDGDPVRVQEEGS